MNKELKIYKGIIINERTDEILREFEIELSEEEANKWKYRNHYETFENIEEFLELQDKLSEKSGLKELQDKIDDELWVEII